MMIDPMLEMGGMTNHGDLPASMVNVVDKKTTKPNKMSLGGNKLGFVFCACGGGGWRIASCQTYVVPSLKKTLYWTSCLVCQGPGR